MFTSARLTVGTVYTRSELQSMFEIREASVKNGIFQPRNSKSVWIFVTERKQADRTPYNDLLQGDFLRWEGQTSGRTDNLVIQHQAMNNEVLVFYRKKKYEFEGAGFRYLGRFRYLSHEGSSPTKFLLKREIPSITPVSPEMEGYPLTPPENMQAAENVQPKTAAILSSPVRSITTEGPQARKLGGVLTVPATELPDVLRKARRAVELLPDPYGPPQSKVGLMLGRIQAGKTNGMIATTAVAMDNGFKIVIVLTSDNTWLYEQTLGRFKEALPSLTCAGYNEWTPKKLQIRSTLTLPHGGVLLVTTKNGTRLKSLVEFLRGLGAQDIPALIFDDEADQASLDANAFKPGSIPTPVNAMITKLRNMFYISGFMQVTATPQAILLLDKESPYRPEFTVVLDPGSEYAGADVYFAEGSKYLVPVPLDELAELKRREGGPDHLPDGLCSALCTFYVAATAKRINSDPQGKYSCLVHISQETDNHKAIGHLIQGFVVSACRGLSSAATPTEAAEIRSRLLEAYRSLQQTCDDLPAFDRVVEYLSEMLLGTDIQVLNSKNAEKQARYDSPYNILIGGTKLGRGVTIKGLLVTYYGRESKNPQMDTVQQHARMYGYRRKDLAVSRIFLPDELAGYFRGINTSENELRTWLKAHPDERCDPQIIPRGMKATRSQVLSPYNVGCFVPGSSYTPGQMAFVNFEDTAGTNRLDRILGTPSRGRPEKQETTITRIIEILSLVRTDVRSAGTWEDKRVQAALSVLRKTYADKAYLVTLGERRLTAKGKANVADSDDLKLVPANLPSLFMFRQVGDTKDGWKGVPFWIPVVRFPEDNHPIAFNFA